MAPDGRKPSNNHNSNIEIKPGKIVSFDTVLLIKYEKSKRIGAFPNVIKLLDSTNLQF